MRVSEEIRYCCSAVTRLIAVQFSIMPVAQSEKMGIDFRFSPNAACDKDLLGYRMLVDKKQLLQVLHNLFSNALKYSHLGGNVAVRAYLTNDASGHTSLHHIRSVSNSADEGGLPSNWLRIEVTDDGVGISKVQH